MNFRDNELLSKLILLGEFILVILLGAIVYLILPHGNGSVIGLLVINACVMVLLFIVLRTRQQRIIRQSLTEVSRTIKRLEENLSDKVTVREGNSSLMEFYTELESLRVNLVQREAMRQEALRMVNSIATNMELEQMLQSIMPEINKATNSTCSAFYLVNQGGDRLEIKHSIGFSKNLYGEFDIKLGEGIVGNVSAVTGITVLKDIPDDTVYVVRSFLGKIKPKSMMTVPVVNQDKLLGVLVLASVYSFTTEQVETMELLKHYLGVAVFNGISYERNKRMTNELTFQNRLIQELNNDLELKVMERSNFLNDTIDSIKDYAIYALNRDGIILAWNKGAENLLGYTLDEVLGEHVEFIYPPEIVKANTIKNRLDAALRDGRYMESGWRTKKDGISYYAEMTLFARYGKNDEIIGFTNVTRDITAFKRVESQLIQEREFSAAMMKQCPMAMLLLDEDFVILKANSKAAALLNDNSPTGLPFLNYVANDEALAAELKQALRRGTELETEALMKTGGSVAVEVMVLGGKSNEGKSLLVKIKE